MGESQEGLGCASQWRLGTGAGEAGRAYRMTTVCKSSIHLRCPAGRCQKNRIIGILAGAAVPDLTTVGVQLDLVKIQGCPYGIEFQCVGFEILTVSAFCCTVFQRYCDGTVGFAAGDCGGDSSVFIGKGGQPETILFRGDILSCFVDGRSYHTGFGLVDCLIVGGVCIGINKHFEPGDIFTPYGIQGSCGDFCAVRYGGDSAGSTVLSLLNVNRTDAAILIGRVQHIGFGIFYGACCYLLIRIAQETESAQCGCWRRKCRVHFINAEFLCLPVGYGRRRVGCSSVIVKLEHILLLQLPDRIYRHGGGSGDRCQVCCHSPVSFILCIRILYDDFCGTFTINDLNIHDSVIGTRLGIGISFEFVAIASGNGNRRHTETDLRCIGPVVFTAPGPRTCTSVGIKGQVEVFLDLPLGIQIHSVHEHTIIVGLRCDVSLVVFIDCHCFCNRIPILCDS